jgi:hypothetical protein
MTHINKKIEVGDIMCGTWGYSMTLPQWYKVVKRTNKTVWIVELNETIVSGRRNGYWESMPSDVTHIDYHTGKEILLRRKVKECNGECVEAQYGRHVWVWDGKSSLSCNDMD